MNARIAAIILSLLPLPALAQSFAGLGAGAEGFAMPAPDPVFRFPADHAAHPEFRIEWWYLTATLTGEDGQDYGAQWTLFRSATRPEDAEGWDAAQVWMGHAAVTSAAVHLSAERLARGGTGQAGARARPFAAWIDDWAMTSTAADGQDALDALTLTARGEDFSYDLALQARGPLVFHGADGYSVKSADGQASYYYSQPFYAVSGTLVLPEGPVAVTGTAWLDREWSSQPLSPDQSGWDWLALQFEDGARLMAGGVRATDGSRYLGATWIAPDGAATAYGNDALRLTPLETARVAGRDVPVRWRVELPDRGIDVETEPLNPRSWMDTLFSYWEGPIRFSGTQSGRGYLEMTGYE